MTANGETMAAQPAPSALRRWLPLIAIAIALALVFAFDLHRYLSFDTLRDHRQTLLAMVESAPVLAPLCFIALYAAVVALSVPGGAVLTLASGFLFGTLAGGLFAMLGATAGAVAIFLVARSALGDALEARAGPWLVKMEEGFRENAFSYLLVLRLVPIFPFWLVNLVPAFLGVKLSTYALATAIGIIPGTMVYASVGNGLGSVFESGGEPDLGIIFRPEILLPILGLAALALVPVAWRRFGSRRFPATPD